MLWRIMDNPKKIVIRFFRMSAVTQAENESFMGMSSTYMPLRFA
jgi:hypothetical protein